MTGGILVARQGPQVIMFSALLGGVILAMIEGVGLLTTKWMGYMMNPMEAQMPVPLEDPSVLAKQASSLNAGTSSSFEFS